MISAVLFVSFFYFPDHGRAYCNLSGTVFCVCDPVFRNIADHSSDQYVCRNQ